MYRTAAKLRARGAIAGVDHPDAIPRPKQRPSAQGIPAAIGRSDAITCPKHWPVEHPGRDAFSARPSRFSHEVHVKYWQSAIVRVEDDARELACAWSMLDVLGSLDAFRVAISRKPYLLI